MNQSNKIILAFKFTVIFFIAMTSFFAGGVYWSEKANRDVDRLKSLSVELIGHTDADGQDKIFEVLQNLETYKTTIIFDGD